MILLLGLGAMGLFGSWGFIRGFRLAGIGIPPFDDEQTVFLVCLAWFAAGFSWAQILPMTGAFVMGISFGVWATLFLQAGRRERQVRGR